MAKFHRYLQLFQPHNMLEENDIDSFIVTQNSSIKLYISFTLGLVIAGILILLLGSNKSSENVVKISMQLGGGFIAALSGLPIKEVISKKEKIAAFVKLKELIRRIKTANEPAEEKDKYTDLVFEILKKNALQ
ncbi:MAG: hypothetical protein ACOH2A_04525 [Sphingobacteriaceae bacterium]